ncbi:MAG: prepilin-type N-terminal cleavage/methylation domain-containing protein, partial [Epulopiscium sp.]|nr:prepilin-type N-terminal cleavage/methylation domain-containing protein [Candidatus Epulonipiscium sp.]
MLKKNLRNEKGFTLIELIIVIAIIAIISAILAPSFSRMT